jgi:hypothetical protein
MNTPEWAGQRGGIEPEKAPFGKSKSLGYGLLRKTPKILIPVHPALVFRVGRANNTSVVHDHTIDEIEKHNRVRS